MPWILAHFLGDFIIQNDWIAAHKKTNSFACLIHVLTYLIPFLFCDFTVFQLFLIGIQHFFQDRTKFVEYFMDLKGSAAFRKNLGPWSVIVTDNILHVAWIQLVVVNVPF